MNQRNRFWSVSNSAVMIGIAVGVGLLSVQPASAGCEARCKAAKAAGMCKTAMDQKGLKGPQRQAEFEKCRADPYNYK